MNTIYSSWVHGHGALLERDESPLAIGRSTVKKSFMDFEGDIIDLGKNGAVACLRIGWAGRFVVFDSSDMNKPKSGGFWVHYAVPTPVVVNLQSDTSAGNRAIAKCVLLNYESQDINKLRISAVHVWDGNRKIGAFDNFPIVPGGHNGGIVGGCSIADQQCQSAIGPEIWRGHIQPAEPSVVANQSNTISSLAFPAPHANDPVLVNFGIGVSIHVEVQSAKDIYLEIRGVGFEFDLSG